MIEILRGDITTLHVDAIVNAANAELLAGGGVDGAIHRAAGPRLQKELRQYPGCPVGGAVITRGYNLPARFVIHAVGPIWQGGRSGEATLLERAYDSAFRLARDKGSIASIAFPAISTGIYGYPRAEAARIALSSMLRCEGRFERIVAALFDADSERIYRDALQTLRQQQHESPRG
jgi:O-acetyl-ADP-ribose deacetylase (regulator of RNase III)